MYILYDPHTQSYLLTNGGRTTVKSQAGKFSEVKVNAMLKEFPELLCEYAGTKVK